MNYFIVVPEGLKSSSDKDTQPSFVFKQVLEYTSSAVVQGDRVFFAPANSFGTGSTEQKIGGNFLKELIQDKRITISLQDMQYKKYIDTFENAILLMRQYPELKNLPIQLVVANIHSYRAKYCFKMAGFKIKKIHRVRYKIFNEPIVNRLWYYRYPYIHCIYELIALLWDFLTSAYRLKSLK